MSYTIHILHEGYSYSVENTNSMKANCTCTLLKGPKNIIIDTMTPWNKDIILTGIAKHDLTVDDINYVISTHGHSDHIGNNNLFLKAKHIVGYSISYEDLYEYFPFDSGKELVIDENIKIVPTPGHTLQDITVVVETNGHRTAITGDLFEKEEDIKNPYLWMSAGSDNPALQQENREKIANICNTIIPGHGPSFKVSDEMKLLLKEQNTSYN